MRTIKEIKESIAAKWMENTNVREAYGLSERDSFSQKFCPVSIENLLFYVVAVCIHVVEAMVDSHSSEVDERIAAMRPHTPRWYRNRVLEFMDGMSVGEDGTYDLTGLSEEDVQALHPIKYAAATENSDVSVLRIKVAGENDGNPVAIGDDMLSRIKAYINTIKDAGVRVVVESREATKFSCSLGVYYDAEFDAGAVEAACENAITDCVRNLPFNGEYTNMALVDAVQAVEGVKVVRFGYARHKEAREDHWTTIPDRYIPLSGYFSPEEINLTMEPY